MPQAISKTQRAGGRLRWFTRDEGAAVAVEFALVSPLVIALLMISLMTGIIYIARAQLDAATQTGARAVMVGSATTSTQLQSAICGEIGGLFNCSNLLVNVNSYSSLASINTAAPTISYNGSGAVSNSFGSSFGGAGSIMVLQVMYQFPMIGTSLFNLATQANGTDLLISTAVFINE